MPTAPQAYPADLVRAALLSPGFRRGTFGGTPRGGPCPWKRVIVRPLQLKGRRHWQFGYFDAKQHFAKNIAEPELEAKLCELLAFRFAGIHIETADEALDIRTSKKGVVSVGRSKSTTVKPEDSHNRTKEVPLPEGRADPVLETMGILAADGRVKAGMRGKFAQINEFLRHLWHALGEAELLALGRPLRILDCGCGSSYLTIAAHHYLNDVRSVPAMLIGIDVNQSVIRKCAAKAHLLDAEETLQFLNGRIAKIDETPDVVLALHACDTATDDALAHGVKAGAKLILAAPCCHKQLNRQLEAEGPLKPVLRHGILRERTADIFTDAFRALLLRLHGYRTDVVEFVSAEHTARNVLIRAVAGSPAQDPAFADEYRRMKEFCGVVPYLEGLLSEEKPRS